MDIRRGRWIRYLFLQHLNRSGCVILTNVVSMKCHITVVRIGIFLITGGGIFSCVNSHLDFFLSVKCLRLLPFLYWAFCRFLLRCGSSLCILTRMLSCGCGTCFLPVCSLSLYSLYGDWRKKLLTFNVMVFIHFFPFIVCLTLCLI